MIEIISVVNEKGGVGKTTIASYLGAGLSRNGLEVLSIDLDAQGNLTHIKSASEDANTIVDVLTGKIHVSEAIQHTEQGDVIPSSPMLSRLETLIKTEKKEERLKVVLQGLEKTYDVIILDLPPGLSIVTIMALTASTSALIPVVADILSVKGVAQLHQIIESVRENSNPSLRVMGMVLNRHNQRSILRREMAEVLRETAKRIDTKIFATKIREAIAVCEAQAEQIDIYRYAPTSKVAKDYENLTNEVLKILNTKGIINDEKEF